jgi:alpha-methylacyl-CoA racemase
MAAMAGHDLNYLGLSGALGAMGPDEAPPPVPLNLIGDYGGGAMMLALGVVAATLHARATGQGQVVETSIAGGALALTPMLWGLLAAGRWGVERHDNLLDGGAPFYRCYECQDGRHIAVGPLEPKFFQILIEGMGLAGAVKPQRQYDKSFWPELAQLFAETFKTATRDEWARRFDGKDACLTPVLDWAEAPLHPQHQALGSFTEIGGVTQPSAHPLFSQTPSSITGPAPVTGADNAAILARLGYGAEEIAALTG